MRVTWKTGLSAGVLAVCLPLAAQAQDSHPTAIVSLPSAQSGVVSGRLLIFAENWDKAVSDNHGAAPAAVDADEFFPNAVFVAARGGRVRPRRHRGRDRPRRHGFPGRLFDAGTGQLRRPGRARYRSYLCLFRPVDGRSHLGRPRKWRSAQAGRGA